MMRHLEAQATPPPQADARSRCGTRAASLPPPNVRPSFAILGRGLDTSPILADLDRNPDLWGQDRERMDFAGSPFAGTDDIWVRSVPREELKRDRMCVDRPHFAAFWPAWERLPALHPLVWALVAEIKPVALGSILITRVPPGGAIREHADTGWHPTFMNMKAHVALASNDGCLNVSVGEAFTPQTGDVFTFDNTLPHSIRNDGGTDRITAIICMRIER